MQRFSELEAPHQSAAGDFLDEVLHGLSLRQKALPCRFLYDRHGSELFEQITELPEYYPTRTEIALLTACSQGLREALPRAACVVEFGSGSSRKTGLLLEALDRPSAYVPIDISASALFPAARRIQQTFAGLHVHPILGGFHDLDAIELPFRGSPRIGFFPGSTIGNLTPVEAVSFLAAARHFLGRGGRLIVGADLQKPLEILLPAYDDAEGVTAAFNRNILVRINRELDGSFDPGSFEHCAPYNAVENRVEMHLRSIRAQRVSVAGRRFEFKAGETIHTENSYKYTVPGFHALAAAGGWTAARTWTDGANFFSLHVLA